MKKVLLSIILFTSLIQAAGAVEPRKVTWEQLGGWTEGTFEIHAISTGKGESLLYIFPDGTTLLVDAGDTTNNGWESEPFPNASKAPGQWIATYIKNYLKTDHIDYFLLSHFHGDHSGSTSALRSGETYAPQKGLRRPGGGPHRPSGYRYEGQPPRDTRLIEPLLPLEDAS